MDITFRSPDVVNEVTSMFRTTELNHKEVRFVLNLISETALYTWYCKNFVTLDDGKQTSHYRSFFLSYVYLYK